MNALTIFTRCREAEDDVRRLKMRIQQRRDALTSITAPPPDPNGGSHGTGTGDRIGTLAIDITDLEAQLQHRNERRRAEVAAACVLLDCLPEYQSRVMSYYYLQGLRVPQIATRMRYSAGYIRKLKAMADDSAADIDESVVDGALPAWYIREDRQND